MKRDSPRRSGTPEPAPTTFFLLAACAIVRLKICEKGRPFHGNVSVLTVIFFWCWWVAVHDGRDLLTGFKLDMTMKARGSLVPTLLAHAQHGSSINLGWTTPFPASLSDFKPENVTARVELRRINFMVGSRRVAGLRCAMQQLRKLHIMATPNATVPRANKLLRRLHAHGLLLDVKPLEGFTP